MNNKEKIMWVELAKYLPDSMILPVHRLIKGLPFDRSCFSAQAFNDNLIATQNQIDADYISSCSAETGLNFLKLLKFSKAQMRQDIHALIISNYLRNGFFVEIGATDGISLSNTYLLEKHFGWSGIVVEPSPQYKGPIHQNRSCVIETKCVLDVSMQEIDFIEYIGSSLSGIKQYNDSNRPEIRSKTVRTHKIETISLNDLLKENNAPHKVNYMSVDTEGSEATIFNAFDFSEYSFDFLTVEHNYTNSRHIIFEILSGNGYRRIYENLSQWDDWYIPIGNSIC